VVLVFSLGVPAAGRLVAEEVGAVRGAVWAAAIETLAARQPAAMIRCFMVFSSDSFQ
jgi:hypothetical protein